MECDVSMDEQDVLPSGSGTQDSRQISPLILSICSCGNEASPVEHDGVYCSIVCAHDDTYEALINGSSTTHYHRIQKARRSSSLSSPGFVELASSDKGSVLAQTDALHDHAYMSIEEWASLDPVVENATSPSDIVDTTLKKAGELAQKQRKGKAASVRRSSKEMKQPISHLKVDEQASLPQFPICPITTSPQSPPRRQRGRAVNNVRPALNT